MSRGEGPAPAVSGTPPAGASANSRVRGNPSGSPGQFRPTQGDGRRGGSGLRHPARGAVQDPGRHRAEPGGGRSGVPPRRPSLPPDSRSWRGSPLARGWGGGGRKVSTRNGTEGRLNDNGTTGSSSPAPKSPMRMTESRRGGMAQDPVLGGRFHPQLPGTGSATSSSAHRFTARKTEPLSREIPEAPQVCRPRKHVSLKCFEPGVPQSSEDPEGALVPAVPAGSGLVEDGVVSPPSPCRRYFPLPPLQSRGGPCSQLVQLWTGRPPGVP